jgi:hypothetical protein
MRTETIRENGYFYIKVKILSLAAEAKIIRKQEAKARAHGNSSLRRGLAEHRRGIVRHEARHAQLAYGFLRGMPYKKMEAKCHPGCEPDFKKVRSSIERYVCARRELGMKINEKWGWMEMQHEPKEEWEARKGQILSDFDKWVEEAKS